VKLAIDVDQRQQFAENLNREALAAGALGQHQVFEELLDFERVGEDRDLFEDVRVLLFEQLRVGVGVGRTELRQDAVVDLLIDRHGVFLATTVESF
jgi:hypothetical protein